MDQSTYIIANSEKAEPILTNFKNVYKILDTSATFTAQQNAELIEVCSKQEMLKEKLHKSYEFFISSGDPTSLEDYLSAVSKFGDHCIQKMVPTETFLSPLIESSQLCESLSCLTAESHLVHIIGPVLFVSMALPFFLRAI